MYKLAALVVAQAGFGGQACYTPQTVTIPPPPPPPSPPLPNSFVCYFRAGSLKLGLYPLVFLRVSVTPLVFLRVSVFPYFCFPSIYPLFAELN